MELDELRTHSRFLIVPEFNAIMGNNDSGNFSLDLVYIMRVPFSIEEERYFYKKRHLFIRL